MNREELIKQIFSKQSFLCVGLDVDLKKVPEHLLTHEDPIFDFNKSIIDATAPYCVAYKPNLAFYEAFGVKGVMAFEKTVKYLKEQYPHHFIIADAKRGDIGNTSAMYARTFFEEYNVDALTVAPYMGEDSVTPFLTYQEEWVNDEQMMYVVGATQGEMFKDIRKVAPHHFLLVPGVGAQGGSLHEVCKYGMTADCGLLVNSSRGIIYAGHDEDYAEKAAEAAQKLQSEMADELKACK